MRFYHIGLGIWIFMLILSMVNSLNIFTYQMPTTQLNGTQSSATITELTDKAAVSQDSPSLQETISGVGGILNAISYMKSAFVDSIHIMAIARKYQIDDRISAPFEAMLLLIYSFGMWQFITGRGTKIMD